MNKVVSTEQSCVLLVGSALTRDHRQVVASFPDERPPVHRNH